MKLRLLAGALVVIILAGLWFWTAEKSPESSASKGLTPVTFVSDWKAQAEHGGFYEALALGYYKDAGLDVTIRQGGPDVNVPQLLATGTAQFGLGSNSPIAINNVAAGVPATAVAAIFQKDPQVLMAHPRDDIRTLADMKGKPILVSDATIAAFWPWLKAKYGFSDDQIRKYTGNLAPFLTDKNAIQEGYLTSEPYTYEQEMKEKPLVFLLADSGYTGYGAFVLASNDLIASKPELVQAFVDATIKGWYSYLYGDAAPANALILNANPDMTQEIIDQSIAKMKSWGIVDSGDTLKLGIGAMTDARWQSFFDEMVKDGVYPATTDYKKAYTTQFVDKGVGMELKKQ